MSCGAMHVIAITPHFENSVFSPDGKARTIIPTIAPPATRACFRSLPQISGPGPASVKDACATAWPLGVSARPRSVTEDPVAASSDGKEKTKEWTAPARDAPISQADTCGLPSNPLCGSRE